jgi:hypothetical protein
MKALTSLRLAAVIGCGLLATSCQKESDSMQPAPVASVASDAMPVYHPIFSEVGRDYNHFPILTGASGDYYIPMTLVAKKATPVSTMESWVSKAVVPAQYLPLDNKGNAVSLPYVFMGETSVTLGDGSTVLITTKATWKKDGTVEMTAKDIFNR